MEYPCIVTSQHNVGKLSIRYIVLNTYDAVPTGPTCSINKMKFQIQILYVNEALNADDKSQFALDELFDKEQVPELVVEISAVDYPVNGHFVGKYGFFNNRLSNGKLIEITTKRTCHSNRKY